MEERVYWIWFQHALGFSTVLPWRIRQVYPSLKAFYEAGVREWRLSGLLRPTHVEKMEATPLAVAEETGRRCEELGYRVFTPDCEDYPERLRNIACPPPVLYAAGVWPDFDREVCVAAVGTRTATPYGLHIASRLGYALAKAGAVVVSGGALGVDTAAHRGALLADGRTVAVLGCGINTRYLVENIPLRRQIAQKGAVISEYPPDTPAIARHFPLRNRILAGLCLGTVVVEADQKSGSLITARQALEEGRDVFAVPGSLMSKNSAGANSLIQSGAKPVACAQDILEEYDALFPGTLKMEGAAEPLGGPGIIKAAAAPCTQTAKPEPETPPEGLSPDAMALWNRLSARPQGIDELAAGAGLPANRALAALTELELSGNVTPLPGKRYARAGQ